MTLRKRIWMIFRPQENVLVERLKKSDPIAYEKGLEWIKSVGLTEHNYYNMLIAIQCYRQFDKSPQELDPNHIMLPDKWAEIAYYNL